MGIHVSSRLMLVIVLLVPQSAIATNVLSSTSIDAAARMNWHGFGAPSGGRRISAARHRRAAAAATPPKAGTNQTSKPQDVSGPSPSSTTRGGRQSLASSNVANWSLIKELTVAAKNKYAKAADVLAGKNLAPAANIPFVEEWTAEHDWDEVESIESNNTKRQKRSEGSYAIWPLKSHLSGGLDILYYGSMSIGTPRQTVDIEIDSGSSDLWVSTNQCNDCDSTKRSRTSTKTFDGGKSSSYGQNKEPFHAGYGTGAVCGSVSTEKVQLNGIESNAQFFGGVFKMTGSFKSSPATGLLGLAFGTMATSKQLPLFENLLSQRKLAAPYFGISLTRGKGIGSELCLGCVNKSKWKGNIEFIPVTKKSYWLIPLTGYSGVPGAPTTTPPAGQMIAAIDTGTSLLYFPSELAISFYSGIPKARAAPEFGQGTWVFPCDTPLKVVLEFGGKPFQMSSVDFNLGRTKKGSPDCVGSIIDIGKQSDIPGGLVIIGAAFLKNWYSIFDYSHGARVGFAASAI